MLAVHVSPVAALVAAFVPLLLHQWLNQLLAKLQGSLYRLQVRLSFF